MNWKTKSLVQRTCAAIPVFHESIYYGIQRAFGRLRVKSDPTWLLSESARLAACLRDAGTPVEGARIMEVGTGRGLDMPLGLYLAGAKSIRTYDLHRYLKPHRVLDSVAAIRENREKVSRMFVPVTDKSALQTRLDALLASHGFAAILRTCGIEYMAPADAADTKLPPESIDIQISYTVFEHIPGEIIVKILREANRILTPNGIALHHIDPSDHFAHDDPTISFINFLRFSRSDWEKYGGNQFAYHNRLRTTDYKKLYREAGHHVEQWRVIIDERSLAELANGFPLHDDYGNLPPEVVCGTVVHALSRPQNSDA
jgi:SAM-dependent methyltransferase